MNRIEIIGFLGQDSEVKEFQNNQVINFSVAVDDSYKNQAGEKIEKTIWFECARWGNNVQIAPHLKKGTQVFITGKPNNRAYAKEDGTIVVVNGITVENIKLL